MVSGILGRWGRDARPLDEARTPPPTLPPRVEVLACTRDPPTMQSRAIYHATLRREQHLRANDLTKVFATSRQRLVQSVRYEHATVLDVSPTTSTSWHRAVNLNNFAESVRDVGGVVVCKTRCCGACQSDPFSSQGVIRLQPRRAPPSQWFHSLASHGACGSVSRPSGQLWRDHCPIGAFSF